MLDINLFRNDLEGLIQRLNGRADEADLRRIALLDDEARAAQTRLQHIQGEINQNAKAVGQAKRNGEPTADLLQRGIDLKRDLTALQDFPAVDVKPYLARIPNIPADDVVRGTTADDNVIVQEWGDETDFRFIPKPHYELNDGLNFEAGGKIGGTRLTVLEGVAARLHRALGQLMLDMAVDNGWQEKNVPVIVNEEAMFGTGQLPKFADDLYRINDRQFLIPTAEVALTNLYADQIIDDLRVPIRMVALTQCFRAEAGAAGRDTRGLIRQHQFEKVELVTICRPERAAQEHQVMLAQAEAVLKALNLPFRRVMLCTGDMGFGAQKTYDLEVWLPGMGEYREISSVSHCGDFQARRMKTRYRDADGKPQFVHTLNGSALAVGRTLVAVMENYQREDGTIEIPDALLPYWGRRR